MEYSHSYVSVSSMIGPLIVRSLVLVCSHSAALSGYGVMASHAAGELVAQMVTQAPTTFSEKPFAFPEFLLTPDRYTRPPPEPAASEDGSARRPVGGQL